MSRVSMGRQTWRQASPALSASPDRHTAATFALPRAQQLWADLLASLLRLRAALATPPARSSRE
eukprot:5863464-Lingulodinium_polyedra.AAC.1